MRYLWPSTILQESLPSISALDLNKYPSNFAEAPDVCKYSHDAETLNTLFQEVSLASQRLRGPEALEFWLVKVPVRYILFSSFLYYNNGLPSLDKKQLVLLTFSSFQLSGPRTIFLFSRRESTWRSTA